MNIQEYKAKKAKFRIQQNDQTKQRDLCLKCLRPKKACFCSHLKPFQTNFEFCILMHPMEAKKERLGTGRLTHLSLINSRIIVDKTFDQNKELQRILNDENYAPFLLYPGKDSINLSTQKFPKESINNKKPIVLILDGTWPCAKSMMRDSSCLHNLPRISFEVNSKSNFHIKHQPAKFCLSTIESVYNLLEALEKQDIESVGKEKNTLLVTLEELVNFQIKCASDPSMNNYQRSSKPYKAPSERVDSKKWNHRRVCFEE